MALQENKLSEIDKPIKKLIFIKIRNDFIQVDETPLSFRVKNRNILIDRLHTWFWMKSRKTIGENEKFHGGLKLVKFVEFRGHEKKI